MRDTQVPAAGTYAMGDRVMERWEDGVYSGGMEEKAKWGLAHHGERQTWRLDSGEEQAMTKPESHSGPGCHQDHVWVCVPAAAGV